MLLSAGADRSQAPNVKLLDFGLAKLRTSSATAMQRRSLATTQVAPVTNPGVLVGTLPYMAPEQLEGGAVDARTDLFAFGAMLYEMVAGRRAFSADAQARLIAAILKDTPPPIAELRPELPPDVARIVGRCLAKEPTRRYQTALDVRNELEDLERQLSSGEGTRASRARAHSRILRVAASVVGLLLAGAAAYLAWSSMSRNTTTPPLRLTFDQLTSQPGRELFPSLAPDGQWVVYSGEGTGNLDI